MGMMKQRKKKRSVATVFVFYCDAKYFGTLKFCLL